MTDTSVIGFYTVLLQAVIIRIPVLKPYTHKMLIILVLSRCTSKDFTMNKTCPNSTWLVTSQHDTFDVSSPCILAVELVEQHGLSRQARHTELDRLDMMSATSNLVDSVICIKL